MTTKSVSFLLVLAIFTYSGCYDSVRLTREEIVEKKGLVDITVLTKDSRMYTFAAGSYMLSDDTLSGMGFLTYYRTSLHDPFTGSLPVSTIAVIQTEKFNGGKTAVVAVIAGLAVAGIVAVIDNTPNPPNPPPKEPPSGGSSYMSCPFVYTFDGSGYHLESETFAGAVFKGVERTASDVLHHLRPVNAECRLKLVNAREETEYVDELKLIAVDHSAGTRVVPDWSGSLHTISQPIPPGSCIDLRGSDALAAVTENDDVYWKSDLKGRDWSLDRDLRDGLVAEFPKPVDANSVKIVVSGKNTRLAYFALAKIFRLKGDDKLRWYGQLENDPAERSKFARWLMREGMLHIKVWQNDQWVEKSALPDVGPGVEKEQVAVVKISDIPGDVLKVKCECTTDLWRIDQVCVDYSPDGVITTTELSPRCAVNEQGQDVLGLLAASDERYYTTVNGQYAELVFADVPVQHSAQRSYVVRTKGFYYQWLTSEGPAQDELVERILSEPLFGTKVLMPQWIKERAQYEGIAQTIH